MNVFTRLYCRTTQLCGKVASLFAPYKRPVRKHKMAEIPPFLKEKGFKKPLVITGKKLNDDGVATPLFRTLQAAGVSYATYASVLPLASTGTVAGAVQKYTEAKCDCIIAVGGGSVIDTAKAVGATLARPARRLNKMQGKGKVGRKIPFLIAVPTTCGSGSEATQLAVVADEVTKRRFAVWDKHLVPPVALLDESFLSQLPPEQLVWSAFESLARAVEAYISTNASRKVMSDAERAVKMVVEFLIDAFEGDTNAQTALLLASHLSGLVAAQTGYGYARAMAYEVSEQYEVNAGLSSAIMLPIVLKAYGRGARKRLGRLARRTGMSPQSAGDKKATKAFLARLERLGQEFKIPLGFHCLREDDIPAMATRVAKNCNPQSAVPVLMNANELAEVYRKAILLEILKEA